MQDGCQRTHKIELTISRRARSALTHSINNNQHKGNNKFNQKQGGFNKKMIQLTISTCTADKQQQTDSKNGQHLIKQADLAVSQLVFDQKDSEGIVAEPKTMLNSVQQIQNQDLDKWCEYLYSHQSASKRDMIEQMVKTQKKIQYFNDLMKQNSLKFKVQRSERVSKFESYLNKLKQLYKQQLKQSQKLTSIAKSIDQQRKEELYHLLRTKINRDGQRGLNFSPKRLSVFSGISGAVLLSDRSDRSEDKQIRSELFIFDCGPRIKTEDSSHMKWSINQSLRQSEILLTSSKMANTHIST